MIIIIEDMDNTHLLLNDPVALQTLHFLRLLSFLAQDFADARLDATFATAFPEDPFSATRVFPEDPQPPPPANWD